MAAKKRPAVPDWVPAELRGLVRDIIAKTGLPAVGDVVVFPGSLPAVAFAVPSGGARGLLVNAEAQAAAVGGRMVVIAFERLADSDGFVGAVEKLQAMRPPGAVLQ